MTQMKTGEAPGHPGSGPHWESGRKVGVGRACNAINRVWFTVGEGILNEIYYPRPDQPCTKDAGLLITDGHSLFSEEKRDVKTELHWAAPGVPALRLTNTHRDGRYRIHKEIIADPSHDTILQRTRFEPLQGKFDAYRVYFLLAPHLGDEGIHNTARCGNYKGMPMLFAQSKEAALAVACSSGWRGRSVGFVGQSDGWQDISRHKVLHWHYDRAEDGNVALTGEVHFDGGDSFILAIGFGHGKDEAAYQARASLNEDFDALWSRYVEEWKKWQETLIPLDQKIPAKIFRHSAAVLRVHEAVHYPGARVASLSIPWGEVRKQEHAAGYHAVWARDCSQSAMGLLACGGKSDALRTLNYLSCAQEADGHWPQVMWVDGRAYWTGIQIDSVAAPLILYEAIRQEKAFDHDRPASFYWPMIHKAAGFICRNGPLTQQDRWERNGGFSPYTLSMAIAGLVIAGNAAMENGREDFAFYFRDTADAWNAQVENWTYSRESELARSLHLPGCYCRIVPSDEKGRPDFKQAVPLANSLVKKSAPACEMVSPDVWSLVRYGLRPATDAHIRDTTVAIDAVIRTETPGGPVWHRYNNDGYGETPDGEPYCHAGVGRGWPLLVGERAHYELARGNHEEAQRLLGVLESFADEVALLPEQIWDADNLPEKGFFKGAATGSARPLAWAHAEYVQLLRSLQDQTVFNCPRIVLQRYAEQRTSPRHTPWRSELQTLHLIRGTFLRIECTGPFHVRWSCRIKKEEFESQTSPVGLHFIDLPTQDLDLREVQFTLRQERGEEKLYSVSVMA